MARMPKPKAEVVPVSNSLIASGSNISRRGVKNLSRSGRDNAWQLQIWEYYRQIGEFRYACDWVGSTLSKALVFAKLNLDGNSEHVTEGRAAELMSEFYGDDEDRSELFRMLGIHMTATGECFIVGYDSEEDDTEKTVWRVVASTSLNKSDQKYRINNQEIPVTDHDDVLVIRVWRPDPVDDREAFSPSRSVMGILGEIARLTDHVAAQVDSRLAGAGILLMPSEMTFPTPPAVEGEDGAPAPIHRQLNDAESLMEVLQDTMATAIEDRSDPSALVPIVITAPAEAIAAVKHMTFWTELDAHAIELRSEAIRRLALGMDMPPEVMLGAGDSNHWSAWQADEAAIKSHTEPLLKIITTSLAKGYLRPILRSEGVENADRYSIGVDTSEMRLRPNRSKEALELYNLGELSGKALLRETGFDVDDGMDEQERSSWFLRKVASGSTTPELVEAALRALKVDIGTVNRDEVEAETQEARPDPSLKDHPVRELPDMEKGLRRKEIRDNPEMIGLVAAGEQLVVRALERSGNRLKNKLHAPTEVKAMALYRAVPTSDLVPDKLLEDAWDHVGPVADRAQVSAESLTFALDTYCRNLFSSGREHSYELFSTYMQKAIDGELININIEVKK